MSDLYSDPIWGCLTEEIDEQLNAPFCRREGEAYYPNYRHNYDGETLRIYNVQTQRVFLVVEEQSDGH